MGLTISLLSVFLVDGSVVQSPLCLGSLMFGGWSVPSYTCARREVYTLLLLILAWSLPCLHGMAW